jgi:hypothetical protein
MRKLPLFGLTLRTTDWNARGQMAKSSAASQMRVYCMRNFRSPLYGIGLISKNTGSGLGTESNLVTLMDRSPPLPPPRCARFGSGVKDGLGSRHCQLEWLANGRRHPPLRVPFTVIIFSCVQITTRHEETWKKKLIIGGSQYGMEYSGSITKWQSLVTRAIQLRLVPAPI